MWTVVGALVVTPLLYTGSWIPKTSPGKTLNPDIEFNVVSSPLRLRRILALSRPATKSKPTMFSSRVIVATPYIPALTATIP